MGYFQPPSGSPTRILTAAHVVQAANEVVVEFPDGEIMRASVLASRQTHDVALLELEGPAAVAPVEIGDSDAVAVGGSWASAATRSHPPLIARSTSTWLIHAHGYSWTTSDSVRKLSTF